MTLARLAPLALLLPLAAPSASAQNIPRTIELRPGLVITTSVRVAPGHYRLPAPTSLDSAVIVVRGDDITIDFAGATMEGVDPAADPDRAAGVAVRIEGGRNVRILHARIRGYKVGILARGTRQLTLADNDLSYNWKPRLYSLVEHESLVDWLSFHHNEQDEWLRYGAAIYLSGVRGGEIHDNRAEQGMNGLMLVRSDSLRIWNNTFSYNSGLGIALYRSSDNTIVHNRMDYDVRGYSEGFYRRGQDSAGLLIYEQSSRNVVAYNSATHGGDGLFLWAGQSTMDTGAGGANDNLFYANDFSFAPANCMEATFSRNTFVGNRLEGCEYGVWGGYSYDSKIVANQFIRNRTGVAIEHGQNNLITGNAFTGDSTAVNLWANPIEPSDWGYPKHHDTRSRDYRVEKNTFTRNRVGVRAANTVALAVVADRFVGVDSVTVLRDTSRYRFAENTVVALRDGRSGDRGARGDRGDPDARADRGDSMAMPAVPPEYARLAPKPLPGGIMPARSPLETRPRSTIIVDEWGPYDWRSPKLWPVDSVRAVPLRLAALGPPGMWRVVTRRGIAALSRTSGRMMDTIAVTPAPDSTGNWELVLEYRGAETVSPRGQRRAAGEQVRFSYGRFEPPVTWTTRVFAWSDSTDPRKRDDALAVLRRSEPLVAREVSRLDYEGYGRLIPGVRGERIALEATGTVELGQGEYALRTISDDGVRVWVDGVLVTDHWEPHESAVDVVPLGGGRHEVRVEYYQVEGWGELRVEVVRAVGQ